MEAYRKDGAGEELAARESAERRLSNELLDFTYARLPELKWLREMYAPADGGATA